MKTKITKSHPRLNESGKYSKILALIALFHLPMASAQAQNTDQSMTRELYNESIGASIWISPSKTNPQAMHIVTQLGFEYDLVIGGLSFCGTTKPATNYSGSTRFGSSSNVDERTIILRPDGSFDYRGGGVSAYGWSNSGMTSASLPADDGTGLYGIYKDPTSGATAVMFLYFDGRWGVGTATDQGQFATDKGLFTAQ